MMLSRRSVLGACAAGLAAPVIVGSRAQSAHADAATLNIALSNTTGVNTVYAYVTGYAIDNGNALCLLRADGKTTYFPTSPPSTLAPLGADCAIALNASGAAARQITIPRLAAGRIWFSIGGKLTFLLNPGPALVQPSVSNPSDPNIGVAWDFCEFTYNASQLYADISAVDFVTAPIALKLTTTSGGVQTVAGLPAGAVDTIAARLTAQHAADGQGWNKLIVTSGGRNLRTLSPYNGMVLNPGLFSGYYTGYVQQAWAKYATTPLTVDTQASWGNISGTVRGGLLTFPGVGSFAQPSTADIFSCSTGPFNTPGIEMGAITARLCAALNRSTLISDANQPNGENPAHYYTTSPTNHYARIVHQTSHNGLGYAFPYDDVTPTGGVNQSGFVAAANPSLLTVTVGAVHA